MTDVGPPYLGQGLPLPESMGINGAWIIENIVALTLDELTAPDSESVIQSAPKSSNGNSVCTFDAHTVARNLGLSVEILFAENQAGRLFIDYSEEAGSRLFTFKFSWSGVEYRVDFERLPE